MANKKISDKIENIEIEAIETGWEKSAKEEPKVEVKKQKKVKVVSEKEKFQKELKKIQTQLNAGYNTKNRTALLTSQMELQIKLRNL